MDTRFMMMPPRRCSGCHRLVVGRCLTCKQARRQRVDRRRGTATQRGYDWRWHKARTVYLQSHPLCIDCLAADKTVPATVVDHIIPHRGDHELMWDEANWAARCKHHHDVKTAREDGGFGNPVSFGLAYNPKLEN